MRWRPCRSPFTGEIFSTKGSYGVFRLLLVRGALAQVDSVKARIVELRYFGGMSIEETAVAVELSPATVKRHWQAARIWLFNALRETVS